MPTLYALLLGTTKEGGRGGNGKACLVNAKGNVVQMRTEDCAAVLRTIDYKRL